MQVQKNGLKSLLFDKSNFDSMAFVCYNIYILISKDKCTAVLM